MGLPSIDWHIAEMAETWPTFRVVKREGNAAVWGGTLRPRLQTYTLRLAYRAPLAVQMLDARRLQPHVRIVTPQLRPRPGDAEGSLPHVYYAGDDPLDVVLCMFDPDSAEWGPTMNIAQTTVPWAIDWLASYEGWRATGVWTGGGRHVEATAPEKRLA